ncbi:MAG TPA: indole-3-glycerol phosphate synthase TrpC [Solirubrobacteraceae bacterium]|jgi:indole-3-glycerol phosphate synthase
MTSPEFSSELSRTRSTTVGAPTVLDRILSETRDTIEQRKLVVPLEALETQVVANTSSLRRARFQAALARPGIGVIAEFKRRSPSAGALRDVPNLEEIVTAYARGGASALSVLTEGPNFEGSLDDLELARASCDLPVLRKDFLLDPYQLYEARLAGADAILLIVAALDQPTLAALHEQALALSLDVLVEVHDREELARAADVNARLIGVNNRDLRDFSVDVKRTFDLLDAMPDGALVVSESGIANAAQLAELERRGVAAVLVGETLMRAPDPSWALAGLLEGSSAEGAVGTFDAGANFL